MLFDIKNKAAKEREKREPYGTIISPSTADLYDEERPPSIYIPEETVWKLITDYANSLLDEDDAKRFKAVSIRTGDSGYGRRIKFKHRRNDVQLIEEN